jgi:hypothetical protein
MDRRVITCCNGGPEDIVALESLVWKHHGHEASVLVIGTDEALQPLLADISQAASVPVTLLLRDRLDLDTLMAAAVATRAQDIVLRPYCAQREGLQRTWLRERLDRVFHRRPLAEPCR